MKKNIALFILIILLMGLFGMSGFFLGKHYSGDNSESNKVVPKNLYDKVLIISSSSNYAWSYYHSGSVVMGDGTIYKYSLELEDDINVFSFSGLNDKFYEKLEKTDKKISMEDMNKLYTYLMDFDDSYTEPKNTAMDAGQTSLDFVNYDDEEIYLIKTAGDNEYRNKNINTNKVIKILKKYNLRVHEIG